MIALVRHAKAGARGSRNDHLRELTAGGFRQAEGLVSQLEHVTLARVLTSPYVRCRQTVEPLAAARGLDLEETELLAEGASAAEALNLMAELAAAGAALCSHGDVIGAILFALAETGVISASQVQASKGSTWLIEFGASEPRRATYLAAPGSPS